MLINNVINFWKIMEYCKDILRLIEEGQEVSCSNVRIGQKQGILFIEPFLESCLQVSNFYVIIVY